MQDSRHALLLEDEPLIQKLFGIYLEELGFEVIKASSVEEATRILETCPFLAAALLDNKLPDGYGFQIASLLRERFGERIRIVSASADMGPNARWDPGKRNLFDAILLKPCLADDVKRAFSNSPSP